MQQRLESRACHIVTIIIRSLGRIKLGAHHIYFRDYNVEPDTIFFIHPEQVHQLETERNPKGVVLLFTCDFLMSHGMREDFISDLNLFLTCDENPPIPAPRESKPVLQHVTDNIFNEFNSDDVFRFEAISAQLKLFLIECNGISDMTLFAIQPDFHNHALIKKFKKLVEQDFRAHHKSKLLFGPIVYYRQTFKRSDKNQHWRNSERIYTGPNFIRSQKNRSFHRLEFQADCLSIGLQ